MGVTKKVRQVIVFLLAEQEYGVDIGRVYEIIRYGKPVRLPQMDSSLEGVIHLRERIIPVVDLGARLGLAPVGHSSDTAADAGRIVIVDAGGVMVGLKVDAVREVRNLSEESVKPSPTSGGSGAGDHGGGYIEGIALTDDKLIIMLDVGRLFSQGEAVVLTSAGKTTDREVAAVV